MNKDKKSTKPVPAAPKEAKSGNHDAKQLKTSFRQYTAPLARHAYFIFIMFVFAGLAVCLYFVNQAFQIDKAAYKTKKVAEIQRAYGVDRAKDVEDQVLQSKTAGTGPIRPNYDPNRDNPFVEN